MDIGHWLALAGIVLGFVGGIVVVVLSEMQVFQVYPNFEVKIGSNIDPDNSQQKLRVKNVGPIQAKHLAVHVVSSGPISMQGQSCLELTSSSNEDEKTFRADFERMSTNILCEIDFTSVNGRIEIVALTADDSPGRIYFPTKEKEEVKSLNMTLVTYKDSEQVQQDLYFLVMIGAIVEITGTAISFVASQWSKNRRLKELKFNEKELKESLDRYLNEYSSLYEKFVLQEPKEIPIRLKKRLVFLHDRILVQSRELDKIRGMKKIGKKLDKDLTEFFVNWETFEENTINFAAKKRIDISGYPTISQAMEEIKGKGYLDEKFLDEVKSLVEYRNRIAHGLTTPTKKDIRKHSAELETLTKLLEEYMQDTEKNEQ